jgi:hypothetical protein
VRPDQELPLGRGIILGGMMQEPGSAVGPGAAPMHRAPEASVRPSAREGRTRPTANATRTH